MSRCFPYPPPGYSRNGATYEALIESIKLQKGTDKAKAERKKQKRAKKEKKEKEKRKDGEKGKLQKNPNEYQQDANKKLQSSVGSKEAHNKRTVPSLELLEKSDLTEEHGQPISLHKPSYSSDSTQNSNKRKRNDAIVPDGTSGHGKPIKIRLLKKNQGPDSNKEALCSSSARTDQQGLYGADARINSWKVSTSGNTDPSVSSASNSVNVVCREDRTSLVLGNRKTGVRENNAVQGNLSQTKSTLNDVQGLHCSRNQSPAPSSGRLILSSSQLKHEIPSSNSSKTQLPVPSQSKKSDVEVVHSSRRQQPTPSYQNHLKNEMPSSSLNVPHAPSVSRKGSEIPVVPTSHLKHVSTKSSGEIKAAGDIQQVEPTRFEKKLRKKHSKYEKLIGSWAPPVFEAQLPGGDDQDWLWSSEKRAIRSSRDVVETCHESAAAALWQPCARFLAEADIHAMPYTVPF